MMWQLMWCNVRAAALNATLQLLVIYRLMTLHKALDQKSLPKLAL